MLKHIGLTDIFAVKIFLCHGMADQVNFISFHFALLLPGMILYKQSNLLYNYNTICNIWGHFMNSVFAARLTKLRRSAV